jgi:hypothetical protein
MRVTYPILCALVGLALCWLPALVHGPIPYKFNIHYLRGGVAVWNWYLARGLIGFFVGITIWPRRWWLRGPLMGLLMLLPPSMISLATPECGSPCMFWNEVSGLLIGLVVGGVAFAVTRRHRAIGDSSTPPTAISGA